MGFNRSNSIAKMMHRPCASISRLTHRILIVYCPKWHRMTILTIIIGEKHNVIALIHSRTIRRINCLMGFIGGKDRRGQILCHPIPAGFFQLIIYGASRM